MLGVANYRRLLTFPSPHSPSLPLLLPHQDLLLLWSLLHLHRPLQAFLDALHRLHREVRRSATRMRWIQHDNNQLRRLLLQHNERRPSESFIKGFRFG
ncbi:Hypothetical protein, putative [Bodo saltans]|uniref:Uncharacterized protein n=1 Tax=Bodo saltans TaxID=75058 RepID=A0A0S4KJ57_BODSA|nr:Hypothetical protein, putative [Bodo saltans]|eukprot:CUI15016.1 Hypothetical protein, putative [Bodo saltans]